MSRAPGILSFMVLTSMVMLSGMNAPERIAKGHLQEEEVWYVWMDTYAMVDGEQTRLVSKAPFAITCCVKSGKYSRLQKSASKWIRNSIDGNYEAKNTLRNLQDESLVLEVIQKAAVQSDDGAAILMVDYSAECK